MCLYILLTLRFTSFLSLMAFFFFTLFFANIYPSLFLALTGRFLHPLRHRHPRAADAAFGADGTAHAAAPAQRRLHAASRAVGRVGGRPAARVRPIAGARPAPVPAVDGADRRAERRQRRVAQLRRALGAGVFAGSGPLVLAPA